MATRLTRTTYGPTSPAAVDDEDNNAETQRIHTAQSPVILEKNQESGLNALPGDRVDPASLLKPALTRLDGQAAADRYQPAGSYVPPGGTPAPEARPRQFVAALAPGQQPLTPRQQQAALDTQLLDERRRQIEERRAALAQQKRETDEHNSAALAEFKGTGQQYYTDPASKRVVPVIEPETNRPLFHKTGWTPGTDPKTGKPALQMRDQYGQHQYKTGPLTHSPDPRDRMLYMQDGAGNSVPAMTAEEAMASPDMRIKTQGFMVARRAMVAERREAIQPLKIVADQATEELEFAKTMASDLDAQIMQLSEQTANMSDPIMIDAISSRIGQLQVQKDQIDQSIKPNGVLARSASRSRRELTIARHAASRDVYAQQAEAIRAMSEGRGESVESNPTYQANQRMMQAVEQSLLQQQEQAAREDALYGVPVEAEAPQQPAPVEQPPIAEEADAPATEEPKGFFQQLGEAFNTPRLRDALATGNPLAALPTNDPLAQNEPEALAARGVKNIGSKTVEEIAEKYGSGPSALEPQSIVALSDRKKELDEMLSPEMAPPGKLSDELLKSLTDERDYTEALFTQRLARMDPDKRAEALDTIDRQTTTATGAAARSAGVTVGPTAAFIAGAKKGAQFMKPTAKITRGVGPIIGGLIGGTLAAITANKAQHKALEKFAPDLVEKLAIDAEQHPIASEVGVMASNAALMKVDPAISVRGVSALWKLAKKEAVTDVERQSAQTFIMNSGLGTAMGVALPLAEGQEITPGSVLQTVAENLFFGDARFGGHGKAPGAKPAEPNSGRPLTPEQQAAEAEFQRRLAEDDGEPELTGRDAVRAAQPDDTKTPVPKTGAIKSAAESAEVFEPGFTEDVSVRPADETQQLVRDSNSSENKTIPVRRETPPAGELGHAKALPAVKSATESALAFQDDAANTRGLAVAEEGAQRLADELAEVSGRPREEILATRTGKEIGQWAEELQSEIEYSRNPLMVDPERRSAELREQLAKADADWQKHIDQTAADAEFHSNAEPVKAEAASRFQADQAAARARHEEITARRAAIEQQLTEFDQLRQSAEGGEKLSSQLSAEQTESAAAQRRLATPELEARRDAIEDGLTTEDRIRQSAEGGERLRDDLAARQGDNPPEAPGATAARPSTPPGAPGSWAMTSERAASVSSKDFSDHYRAKNKAGVEGGLTDDAVAAGKLATTPEQIESLRSQRDQLREASKKALEADDYEAAADHGMRAQFFNEAFETATKTGSFATTSARGESSGTSATPTTEPPTPAVERSSDAATETVGSQATAPVSETPVPSKENTVSRKQVANQRRLVKELQKRVAAIAAAHPGKAGALQKRVADEQSKLADMESRRTTGGRTPKVGYAPNGEPDLLSDIAEYVGTLKSTGGGEADLLAQTLSKGAARLLRSENGTAIDVAMGILNDDAGYKFKSVPELQAAIEKATEGRQKIGAAMATEKYQMGVEMAALGGPREGKFKSGPAQPIEKLGVGAKFKIKGENFSIVDVEEGIDGRWQYVIQDGHKFKVVEGTIVFPDYRSVKNKAPKPSTDFLPPDSEAPAPVEAVKATPVAAANPAPAADPVKPAASEDMKSKVLSRIGESTLGDLFGDRNTGLRQDLMEMATGVRPSKANASITKLSDVMADVFGIKKSGWPNRALDDAIDALRESKDSPAGKFNLESATTDQQAKEAEAARERAKAAAQKDKIETLGAKPLTGDSSDVGQGVLLKGDEDLFSGPSAESLVKPKDAAPISANTKPATPENVEGKTIDKEWTAFSDKSGSLKVPRNEMPQIKSEHRGALVNFLKAREIGAKAVMVNPSDLKPTQAEFSAAKVEKARSFTGSERPILISSDGHVVDGHHQWVAALDTADPMPVIKLNAPIDKVLAEMKEFPSATTAKGAAVTPPAAKRTSDKIIEALQNAKIHKPGVTAAATPLSIAYDGAIDLAILGVRAGRAVNDVVKLAIDRFKAKHKTATPEELAKLETDIRAAISGRPPEPPSGTDKSKVPPSLRKVGVPAKDIEYDVRSQNERMAEARTAIAKDPAKAEQMIGDRAVPADTRVAIGGVLLEKKMTELQSAKPEDIQRITREIQNIVESTRSGVSTETGQGVAMHRKIYENLAVSSSMEYILASTKRRLAKMGGKQMEEAAKEAAEIFNKKKTQAERDAAIEKLKEKYSTKPVQRALDQLKRVEVAKKLNELGALTRDDMIEAAGNAMGIPGINKAKLKHIADLVDAINKAKNHAQRARAELELADTVEIYKGVNPLDLEASILTLNILSGPTTQLANIQGNAFNMITQLGTTAALNPSKIGTLMKGLKDGIPLGWDQAKSIMKTGRGTRDFQDQTGNRNALGKVDYARDFPSLNKTVGDTLTFRARLIDKISRFMRATDAVYYYPAREAYARLVTTKLLEGQFSGAELAKKVSETLHITPEAFVSARKQAVSEGYEGIDLGRRVSDIIEETRNGTEVGAEAVKQSEAFAAESTFNNEPVGLAGVIYRNLARTVKDADVLGVPILKPWAMFLRVPANLFNATTNFTPLGAMRAKFGMKGEKYRKDGVGEHQWKNFNKDERNRLYLQSVIGTTLMAGLTARILTNDDINISASGPSDPNRRRQLQQAGWNPYSIKVGDKWVSYRDTPLLVPLAIVGHVADSVRYQKAKSDMVLGSKVADALTHAPEIIFQTSMLTGLSELMSSLSGNGGSVSRILGSIPANLAIPYNRLLQQVDQTFDKQTYKSDPVTASVPFLRRTGTPQTDVQGRDRTYDPMTRFASTEKNDPVDSILRDKKVFISEPSKTTKVGNRVMTDQEYDRYRQLSGQRIRVRIRAAIPQLRAMNQENAQKRIQQISQEERERVRPLILVSSKR